MRKGLKNLLSSTAIFLTGSVMLCSASQQNYFKLKPKSVPAQYVYYGSIPASGELDNFGLVNRFDIIEATPEYEPIARGKTKRGTGAYSIALARASDQSIRWVQKYGEENRYGVIFEGAYFNSSSVESVPEGYQGKKLEQIADELNVTKDVIDANPKSEK